MAPEERYVSERDAAKFLGLEAATLRTWRYRGEGPSFAKFGRAVRYLWSELQTYAESNKRCPGSTDSAA